MAARSVGRAVKKTSMLLGQCVPCAKQNASKIRIKRMVLDPNLLMYFRKDEFVHVIDTEKICKSGDIVLIQELPEKLTKLITHEILEVVHAFGDIIDPITGKKVVVAQYREDIQRDTELYGKVDSTFDYENAPPRGWLEGKKDFTDKETYIQYHEGDEPQPYAV